MQAWTAEVDGWVVCHIAVQGSEVRMKLYHKTMKLYLIGGSKCVVAVTLTVMQLPQVSA